MKLWNLIDVGIRLVIRTGILVWVGDWTAQQVITIDLNNTGSRIHNKILKSSPPSWYSRSSALCGCKSNLLSSVFNFRKFP